MLVGTNYLLIDSNSVIKDNFIEKAAQKGKKSLPTYKLVSNTGPRHKPLFKLAVKLKNTKYFIAQGTSKKDAEQKAAAACLESVIKK